MDLLVSLGIAVAIWALLAVGLARELRWRVRLLRLLARAVTFLRRPHAR